MANGAAVVQAPAQVSAADVFNEMKGKSVQEQIQAFRNATRNMSADAQGRLLAEVADLMSDARATTLRTTLYFIHPSERARILPRFQDDVAKAAEQFTLDMSKLTQGIYDDIVKEGKAGGRAGVAFLRGFYQAEQEMAYGAATQAFKKSAKIRTDTKLVQEFRAAVAEGRVDFPEGVKMTEAQKTAWEKAMADFRGRFGESKTALAEIATLEKEVATLEKVGKKPGKKVFMAIAGVALLGAGIGYLLHEYGVKRGKTIGKEESQAEIEKMREENRKLNEELAQLKAQFAAQDPKASALLDQIDKLKAQIDLLTRELEACKAQQASGGDSAALNARITSLEKDNAELMRQLKDRTDQWRACLESAGAASEDSKYKPLYDKCKSELDALKEEGGNQVSTREVVATPSDTQREAEKVKGWFSAQLGKSAPESRAKCTALNKAMQDYIKTQDYDSGIGQLYQTLFGTSTLPVYKFSVDGQMSTKDVGGMPTPEKCLSNDPAYYHSVVYTMVKFGYMNKSKFISMVKKYDAGLAAQLEQNIK